MNKIMILSTLRLKFALLQSELSKYTLMAFI